MGFEKDDVVNFREIWDVYDKVAEDKKDIKEIKKLDIEMRSLIVVCKNCGHKDVVDGMMIKNKTNEAKSPMNPWNNYYDDLIQRKKHYPKNYPYVYPKTVGGTTVKLMNMPMKFMQSRTTALVHIDNYEDFFKCPKCGSRAIALSDEARKRILARKI